MIKRVLRGNVAAAPADDGNQLSLIVEEAGHARTDNGLLVPNQAGRKSSEECRVGRGLKPALLSMIGVIQANADHFLWERNGGRY